MSLAIVTTTLPGDVVQISPRGEVDVDTAHEVKEAIVGVVTKSRPARIQLDMRWVRFIDSAGISAMVAGFQAASVSGVKLVVTHPSRFVHRQLWVTGLLGLFGAPEPHYTGAEPDRVEEQQVSSA